jgi:hypothetical protein
MEDEDDLREFRKLAQQYAEATMEERERLRPDFERAIEKVSPGFLETYDTRSANGDYLKDMVDQCMQRVLARPDLGQDRKTNAMEDADDFMTFFQAAKQWPIPKLATHAFEMALRTLFIGMRAGLNQDEVEELFAKLQTERQQALGVKSGDIRRDKVWREYAKNAAPRLHNAHRVLSLSGIAKRIEKEWESEEFEKVEHQQLFKYLSDLVDKGELPSSMKRPARKR